MNNNNSNNVDYNNSENILSSITAISDLKERSHGYVNTKP